MDNKNYIPEKNLANIPDEVPNNILKIIIEQSQNSLCKINCNDRGNDTGFFCKIPFPDKFHQLPVLITNNHIITENDIIKKIK